MAKLLTRRSTVTVSEVPDEVADQVTRKKGATRLGAKGKAPSGGASARDLAAAYAAGYAASAREAATRYGGTAKERYSSDVAPRVAAAKDRVATDVKPRVSAGVAAARDRAAGTLETGGSALDDAKSRGRDALFSVRNRVAPPPPPPKSRAEKLSTPLLLLAAVAAAVAGYQVWSQRSRSDSWDLPTYTSPANPGTSRAPIATDAAGSDPGEARADAVTEDTVEGSLSTPAADRSPSPVDVPGDPTVSDDVAASSSPSAVRSDEGPGISDTSDAATRARAGEAGRAAFGQAATGPDDAQR